MHAKLSIRIPSLSAKLQEASKRITARAAAAAQAAGVQVVAMLAEEAKQKLSDSTAEQYAAGLSLKPIDAGVQIQLRGALPLMLERGAQPFDMKPGFLRKAKVSKTGERYQDVPLGKTGMIRRVSTHSSAASWIHPGLTPLNLLAQLRGRLGSRLRGVLLEELRKRGIIPT